mmetsp:Transcript_28137/g.45180  ORF Transcript_28137/g.45180 Transcript_28137/m.45180 type:complete len:268 (-) Transcript_28137:8-811(-)
MPRGHVPKNCANSATPSFANCVAHQLHRGASYPPVNCSYTIRATCFAPKPHQHLPQKRYDQHSTNSPNRSKCMDLAHSQSISSLHLSDGKTCPARTQTTTRHNLHSQQHSGGNHYPPQPPSQTLGPVLKTTNTTGSVTGRRRWAPPRPHPPSAERAIAQPPGQASTQAHGRHHRTSPPPENTSLASAAVRTRRHPNSTSAPKPAPMPARAQSAPSSKYTLLYINTRASYRSCAPFANRSLLSQKYSTHLKPDIPPITSSATVNTSTN